MIRNNPAHDTKTPAGSSAYRPTRGLYLRDVIKRIQGEEEGQATTPSVDWESRYNSLVVALESLCDNAAKVPGYTSFTMVNPATIRKIIKENT